MFEAEPTPSHRSVAERMFGRIELQGMTARRAAGIIAGATIVTAVAGGVLAWALDREDFPRLGLALWWSLQTVTTVGYGDVVPSNTSGRVIGGVIMLAGIAFIAVVTAAVTATLIEAARRRRQQLDHDLHDQLAQIGTRLAAIEQALDERER
jgi:voltage-gated potassium channel